MSKIAILVVMLAQVDITIAPGVDRHSRAITTVLTQPLPEPDGPASERMIEIRKEIESVAKITVLDPLEVNGVKALLPAYKINRSKWVSIPTHAFNHQYGSVIWLRSELDGWILDAEVARRRADYDRRVKEYHELCNEISKKFYTKHSTGWPYLGEYNSRIRFDEETGVKVYITPVFPKWPELPDDPTPFNEQQWIEPWRLGPVEASR